MADTSAGDLEATWARFKLHDDQSDRQSLLIYYSPLVKYVASRMGSGLPPHVDRSELVCYGMFGLIDAVTKFDLNQGYKFETYAIPRIRGAILDELRSFDWVPRSVRAKATAVERAIAKLESELHRSPTEDEIATEMGVTRKALEAVFLQIRSTGLLALDELVPVGDGTRETTTLGEALADQGAGAEEAYERMETRQLVAAAINRLPERERVVLTLYYYERMTLAEIGRVLGVSEGRICQIHTKAVVRMRASLSVADRQRV